MRVWYWFKWQVLELLLDFGELLYFGNERWLYEATRKGTIYDTGQWASPNLVKVRHRIVTYAADIETGEKVTVHECIYVGRGILRGWHLFEQDIS